MMKGYKNMLRYIESEVLRKKRIYFHNGFNAVLGDDLATNSIGKTSLLLMVDFILYWFNRGNSNSTKFRNVAVV